MNKKFSTILTMVLLLVGALFSNANAAKTLGTIGGDAKLANGVKFYLGNGTNYLVADPAEKFTDSSLKDVEFVAFNGTLGTADKATLFEVADYSFRNNQSYFSLKVNGVYVYNEAGRVATKASKAADVTKVFRVKGDKIAFAQLFADIVGATELADNSGKLAFGSTDAIPALKPCNESATITAKDLNGLSEKVSLSFAIPTGTTLFEDNIFGQEMYAIQAASTTNLDVLAANTVYFIVGSADNLKAVKAQIANGLLIDEDASLAAIKADGIQVVSLKKGKSYNIKNAPKGEGMQFVMEKGKDAFASKDAANNAGFVVTELDKTNNPGVYQLEMTPNADIVKAATPSTKLYVGAIRFTPSDAKSYITTVVGDNKSKLSLATNGISADLDASILLKSKAMNVVNIYFTSGVPSTSDELNDDDNTEYHKYLVAASNGSTFELNALPLDKLAGFASPLSQWVVTGFDGHNKFTFTNREATTNVSTLVLTLLPTEVAGEYKIVDAGSVTNSVANIYANTSTAKKSLVGKTVKFNTIAATNPYLDLSKDEMKVAMSLNFSGKDATFGEKTFYGKFSKALDAYSPSKDEATADFYFAKVTDKDKKANYIQNVLTYAYLDGEVVKTAKDTLFVPSYTLKADGSDDKKGYLKSDYTLVAKDNGEGEFVFRKNADGTYAMTVVNTGSVESGKVKYTDFAKATATAINLNAKKDKFESTSKFFAPEDADFAAVTLVSADADRISLPAVPRHASFDNKLGSVSMQDANGINEGILKAEGLTFWLDTADSKATIPSFYISLGIPTKADAPAERMYMYNSADSLKLFNEGGAIEKENKAYELTGSSDAKAIFRAAVVAAIDTLNTTVDGKPAVVAKKENRAKEVLGGIDNFKYSIYLADNDVEDEYVIVSKGQDVPQYLYSLNGKLGFTDKKDKALVVTLGKGTATSNEAISSASTVKVIAGNGEIQIVGAQGKNVIVANALGQTVANEVVSSDNATISVPAGFVIVNVEGEAFKALVK